ncbi:serine/threonine-protein kinase ATG1a [Amaranthus tricolor]|uniref:serine/threonine-protein kinase ATG1a n=1 Tax=Amaranthus tricolor TaxID=29722 RepID=UPI00258E04D8|nr:serine/threonine-protein kinase ATG1a [Amaranthus tricolor]
MEKSGCRTVGDYIIGPKIGSGSFAVVWKSKHRVLGTEFAIKEIDKKNFNDNLRKEISILSNISHPNIIRLFEAIETEERIYLVLEYCDGGDLGAYIHRHGRVSEDVARHFIKQLAVGLQVLRDNNLIHRDLKPQNLLLSSKEVTPMLKIGDFGFARYLTPQSLADTLCGSPLYMAPEIIQNQKYDAKADLWSVGAICYQLVIGKPPFDGNTQHQLFQNVLTSTELRFPEGALPVLQHDFVEFCRSLLRRNPVERLTFEEFFNHKFLRLPRFAVNAESSGVSRVESVSLTNDQFPDIHHKAVMKASEQTVKPDNSVNDEKTEIGMDQCSTHSGRDVAGGTPNVPSYKTKHNVEDGPHLVSQTRVAYSLDAIEAEYVLVHSNFASMEILTSSLGKSLKEGSATKTCDLALKNKDKQLPIMPEMRDPTSKLVGDSDIVLQTPLAASSAPCVIREAQELPILHPSARLQLIHHYVGILSDLAREKVNDGFFLESFSVELVVLAVWKEALRICNSWIAQSAARKSSAINKVSDEGAASSSSKANDTVDFTNPSSVLIWAEQGFINAFDGTEKLAKYLQDGDGAAEMPDALEIIFQTAIAAGKDGAADEFVGNRDSAVTLYSKALHLFSFIVAEAPSLPLNPPFTLDLESKQRIRKYMKSLEYHLNRSQISQPSMKQLPGFSVK